MSEQLSNTHSQEFNDAVGHAYDSEDADEHSDTLLSAIPDHGSDEEFREAFSAFANQKMQWRKSLAKANEGFSQESLREAMLENRESLEKDVEAAKKTLAKRYAGYEVDYHKITEADFGLIVTRDKEGNTILTVMLTSLSGIDLGDPNREYDPVRSYNSIMTDDSHIIELEGGQQVDTRSLTASQYFAFIDQAIANQIDESEPLPDLHTTSWLTGVDKDEEDCDDEEGGDDWAAFSCLLSNYSRSIEWEDSDYSREEMCFRPAIVAAIIK